MPELQNYPKTMKAVVLRESVDPSTKLHDVVLVKDYPVPALKEDEVLVKITAASFNRRDHWQRSGNYPRVKYGTIPGGDGVGTSVC